MRETEIFDAAVKEKKKKRRKGYGRNDFHFFADLLVSPHATHSAENRRPNTETCLLRLLKALVFDFLRPLILFLSSVKVNKFAIINITV